MSLAPSRPPHNSLSAVFGTRNIVFPQIEIELFCFRVFLAQGKEREGYSKTSAEKHPEINLTQ